jgi:hypothetical protein
MFIDPLYLPAYSCIFTRQISQPPICFFEWTDIDYILCIVFRIPVRKKIIMLKLELKIYFLYLLTTYLYLYMYLEFQFARKL